MKRVVWVAILFLVGLLTLLEPVKGERVYLIANDINLNPVTSTPRNYDGDIENTAGTTVYECLIRLNQPEEVTTSEGSPKSCRKEGGLSAAEIKTITWSVTSTEAGDYGTVTPTVWACTSPDELICEDETCIDPCESAADCDDSDPCTVDSCSNPGTCSAQCVNQLSPNCGTSCGTGLVYDGAGVCGPKVTSGACCQGQCNSTYNSTNTCHFDLTWDGDCAYQTCTLNATSACTTAGCLCAANTYCDDGNACTIDSCINPGQASAYCSYAQREASGSTSDGCCPEGENETTDRDCAEGQPGETYCEEIGYVNLSANETCGNCQNIIDCTLTGKACCSGLCVNLADDEDNCGGCGVSCAAGEFCLDGSCSGISCQSDADCNDGNNCTINTCANPGTESAVCTTTNRDCGYSCTCGGGLVNQTCVCDGIGNCSTTGISGASCLEQCFPAFESEGVCYYDVEFEDDCVYSECTLSNETVCTNEGCSCLTNAACDDGNECTNDRCEGGVCTYADKTCGTSCATGVCVEGNCTARKSEGQACVCEECEEGLTCEGGNCTKIAGCGNGQCDPGECERCPQDCLPTDCAGDGICSVKMNEDCEKTPEDCKCPLGECDPESLIADETGCVSSWCGDGICDNKTRECSLCPDDCDAESCMGNGQCDTLVGENCENAPDDCSCDLELSAQTDEVPLEAGGRKTISFKVKNTGNKKQSLSVVLSGSVRLGWDDATVELQAGEEAVMNVEVWSEKGGLHYLEIGVEDEEGKTTRTAIPFNIKGDGEVEKAKGAVDFVLMVKDYMELLLLAAAVLGGAVVYLKTKVKKPTDYHIQSNTNWTQPGEYSPSYPVARPPPSNQSNLPSNSRDFPTFRKK